MTAKRSGKYRTYNHASHKRANLATDESAIALDAERVSDETVELGLEDKSSYPRLVWDSLTSGGGACNSLSMAHGPLYTHEKIEPLEFARSLMNLPEDSQSDMFAAFNGLPEGAAFEPYSHLGNWQNQIIKAPSQRVMASLLEREGMRGKVDMVYMDPPYNIDFKSNMQGLVDELDVKEELDSLPGDLGQIEAFRDSYRNGVHSYLDQFRTQLQLIRALLADSGSVFIQIGPSNLHVVSMIMAEVFGSENHVATIPYVTAMNYSTRMLPEIGNWLVWFAKDKDKAKYHQLYEPLPTLKDIVDKISRWAGVELSDGACRALTTEERDNPDKFLPEGARLYQKQPLTSARESTTGRSAPFVYGSNSYPCPAGKQWRVGHDGLRAIAAQGRMDFQWNSPMWKRYADEIPGISIDSSGWSFRASVDKTYAVQTPQAVIERCILMTTDPGDLVLDPTCGSGTTAVASEKWGRRWITSDSSAVAVEVAKRRLLAQIYDWYVLRDSAEGAKMEHELSGGDPADFAPLADYENDPSLGFVYERQRKLSAAALAYGRHEYIHFVDRPRVEAGVKRLTSAFTVQSDSPFRAESPELRERGETAAATRERVLEAIAVSGLNHGGKKEIQVKDFAERDGAAYLTHQGTLDDGESKPKFALFHIADEAVVVSQAHVRMAVREARMSGLSPEVLVIVAFGRDSSSVSDMWSQGGMDVYLMQANRDLMIPQLDNGKRSRTAFTLVANPDLTVIQAADGKLRVRVDGLDVYNSNAGQVEPADARRVSCMMVDTDFNGESFFARRVNFPNVTKGYAKMIERMRSDFSRDIDDEKWEMMKSDATVPFARPESGLISVKIVDHAGTAHENVIDLNAAEIESE